MKIIRNGNCRTISGAGTVIIDNNGRTYINGKPLEECETIDVNEKVINITIEGDVERLEVEYCHSIKVTGNANRIKTNNGDIEIGGDVSGDVHTNMGSITCGNVEGDCHTNMGSINRR